jgi:hypothetical protein
MIYRPVAKISSSRACGAMVIATPAWTVLVNLCPICVNGAPDTHGGFAVSGSPTVYAENLPVNRMGDVNSGCLWPKPHGPQPLVLCDLNTFTA